MRFRSQDLRFIEHLSEKYNLPVKEIKAIVNSQYDFIAKTIKEIQLPRGKNITEEDFSKIKTNFNIPKIGKLYASYGIFNKINQNNK